MFAISPDQNVPWGQAGSRRNEVIFLCNRSFSRGPPQLFLRGQRKNFSSLLKHDWQRDTGTVAKKLEQTSITTGNLSDKWYRRHYLELDSVALAGDQSAQLIDLVGRTPPALGHLTNR
ncbi:hypothetical protein J6590_016216 [Homalodisca vitripennis]|nr:hypothetical protein J6590_016216 [Homalodisca vitripennis]